MATRVRKLVRTNVTLSTQQTLRTAGATERLTVGSYKVTNWALVAVDVTIWFGAGDNASAMCKAFTLDAAPAAGRTGGWIQNDDKEFYVIEPAEVILMTCTPASGTADVGVLMMGTIEKPADLQA